MSGSRKHLETAFERALGDDRGRLTDADRLLIYRLKERLQIDNDDPAWDVFFCLGLVLHDAARVVDAVDEAAARCERASEAAAQVPEVVEKATARAIAAAVKAGEQRLAASANIHAASVKQDIQDSLDAAVANLVTQARAAERQQAAAKWLRGRAKILAAGAGIGVACVCLGFLCSFLLATI